MVSTDVEVGSNDYRAGRVGGSGVQVPSLACVG